MQFPAVTLCNLNPARRSQVATYGENDISSFLDVCSLHTFHVRTPKYYTIRCRCGRSCLVELLSPLNVIKLLLILIFYLLQAKIQFAPRFDAVGASEFYFNIGKHLVVFETCLACRCFFFRVAAPCRGFGRWIIQSWIAFEFSSWRNDHIRPLFPFDCVHDPSFALGLKVAFRVHVTGPCPPRIRIWKSIHVTRLFDNVNSKSFKHL